MGLISWVRKPRLLMLSSKRNLLCCQDEAVPFSAGSYIPQPRMRPGRIVHGMDLGSGQWIKWFYCIADWSILGTGPVLVLWLLEPKKNNNKKNAPCESLRCASCHPPAYIYERVAPFSCQRIPLLQSSPSLLKVCILAIIRTLSLSFTGFKKPRLCSDQSINIVWQPLV